MYYDQTVGWIKTKLGTEVGLVPRHMVRDRNPIINPQRGSALNNFGPCLLWPNGWMNQDAKNATWYGRRPRPRRQCVRWGTSSFPPPPPKKGAQQPPLFGPCLLWPNGWMDQDTTWYGGRPRPRPHCVRWGPSSPPKGHSSPSNVRPMSVVAKQLGGSRCHLVGR